MLQASFKHCLENASSIKPEFGECIPIILASLLLLHSG
jgi:hypothetical protein